MVKKNYYAIVDRKKMTVKCGFPNCRHTAFSRVMLESGGEDLPIACVKCKRHFVYKE